MTLLNKINFLQDYILFVDTEGSGWPKNWKAPYSDKNSWPYSVQIAWVIFSKEGREVKENNYYINDNDFSIEKSAFDIHNIDRDFLEQNGQPRQHIMMLLADDLLKYQPLLVGHFMELDQHMINADFYRAGVANMSTGLPFFCTMKASVKYAEQFKKKYLRLSELYRVLFDREQQGQHNALADAKAAAECFFELLAKGDISYEIIDKSNAEKGAQNNVSGCVFFVLGLALLLILIIELL